MGLRRVREREYLARRAWTDRERGIVWRGFTGRMSIAIEPLVCAIFFALLTYGIIWRSHIAKPHDLWILSPIFGIIAIGFAIYFVALLVAPLHAYLETYKPIYTLDGYVRYRAPDDFSDVGGTGYVAVLFDDRDMCCEWECYGVKRLPNLTLPAHVEFSEFGGIHKIDGKSTGVLPDEELPLLAIGITQQRRY